MVRLDADKATFCTSKALVKESSIRMAFIYRSNTYYSCRQLQRFVWKWLLLCRTEILLRLILIFKKKVYNYQSIIE